MAEDFARAVDDGLKLAKRIYFGKDRAVAAPRPPAPMERSSTTQPYLPTAPMVYAVIPDPGIVDNPDLPSYQPHVHGRCDPPALIPLQMNSIELDVDCYLDTALVTVTGSWRVHCVMGSKRCDCRIAIPMGEQVCVFFFPGKLRFLLLKLVHYFRVFVSQSEDTMWNWGFVNIYDSIIFYYCG